MEQRVRLATGLPRRNSPWLSRETVEAFNALASRFDRPVAGVNEVTHHHGPIKRRVPPQKNQRLPSHPTTDTSRLDERLRRVSDSDREEAVGALRDDLLAGRLTLDEFPERVGDAMARGSVPTWRGCGRTCPSGSRRPGGQELRLSVAAFGHLVRRGRLRLPRRMVAIGAFADP